MAIQRIERKEYLDKLIAFRDKKIIKVVTGVRRCGKSTIMEIYQDYLREQGVMGEQIIAINLEDYDSSKISDVLSYKYDIITRCGAHCAPLMHTHLNTVERGIVRFSLSFMNSMEEVNTVIDVLKEMTEE